MLSRSNLGVCSPFGRLATRDWLCFNTCAAQYSASLQALAQTQALTGGDLMSQYPLGFGQQL
jgi:hypothetical protein